MQSTWPSAFAVATLCVALVGLPALADDAAQANRLMVEAVRHIEAAKTAPSDAERARRLRSAHDRLTEIVQRFPSTELAVQLATGQQIGSVSLAGAAPCRRDQPSSAAPARRRSASISACCRRMVSSRSAMASS